MGKNDEGVAIRHTAGGQYGNTKKARIRLSDIANEVSDSLYIRTKAMNLMKMPAHILLPHMSSQGQEMVTIEIPQTFIPINLAEYAPKEELLRNTHLMNMVQSGLIELMRTDDAEAELEEDTSQLEADRLRAEKMAKLRGANLASKEDDAFRAMNPELVAEMQNPASGKMDQETAGISGTVLDIVTGDRTDDDRFVLIKNIESILTDADRRYIRSHIRDPRILQVIG